MVETVPIFTEIIRLGPMQSFLKHYMKFLKTGFEWEGLLIGQLLPIQVPVLSFQDKRMSYVNVLISFFLDLLPAYNSTWWVNFISILLVVKET